MFHTNRVTACILTVACFFLDFERVFCISRSSFLLLTVSSRGEGGGGGEAGGRLGGAGGGGGGPPRHLNTASISSNKLGPKSNGFYKKNSSEFFIQKIIMLLHEFFCVFITLLI